MAQALPVVIAGPAGQRLYAGRLAPAAPAALSGTVVDGDDVPSGGIVVPMSEPPTTGGLTTTKLRGGSAGQQPFFFGQEFPPGALPAGQALSGAQLSVLSTHPDGSAKFAQVCGYATVSAGIDRPVALLAGTAPAGSAVTGSLAQSSGHSATLDCGVLGSVTFSGADWATPFLVVHAGPVAAQLVYRKPVGADAHLVAWLNVMLFSNGEMAVVPWVENGYLNVAAPTNKSASYSFSLNGSERMAALPIDLKHHQRTPLIHGAALWYWTGADRTWVPIHDAAYLQNTELVPALYGTTPASDTEVTQLPSTFVPLAQGVYNFAGDSMGSTGFQEPIGHLPQHEALHLTAADADRATTFKAVVRGGYSAGRYGIHYRDEATNRPLRFSSHPTLVARPSQGFQASMNGSSTTGTLTPVASGGNPPSWDPAHMPSVGYMAALLTGLWYFIEEAQFSATATYLCKGDNSLLRVGAQNLCQTAVDGWQTRGAAWQWRDLVRALTVTPDNDTALRGEFIASVEANIAHFHGTYSGQVNNPGLILPGETYSSSSINEVAIWQQDFVTAAFGQSCMLGLPISSTAQANLVAFSKWKAKSAIMRLGTSAQWWYINACPYTIKSGLALTQADYLAGTGTWPASDAAWYAATYASPPVWLGSTEGVLAGELFPETGAGLIPSMWHNFQAAVACAVRLAATGASVGYSRMLAATNWSALSAGFNGRPGWGVRPLIDPVATPAWLLGAPTFQWVDMGAASIPSVPLNAWGTLPLIDGTGTLVSPANGGHTDSADNRVSTIDVLQAAPSWTQRIAPSASFTSNVAYMPDGKPVSRHGYHHAHYIAQRGRVMLFAAEGVYESGGWAGKVDGIRVSDWTWDCVTGAATYPALEPFGRGYGVGRDPRTGNVWTGSGWLWDQAANTWSQPGTQQINGSGLRNPFVFDTLRNQFFCLQWGNGRGFDGGLRANVIHPVTGAVTAITFSAGSAAAVAQFTADKPTYMGGDYDPINDNCVFYAGQANTDGGGVASLQPNRLFRVTPNGTSVWDMDLMTVAGTPDTVPSGGAGVNGRLRYVAAIKGFVLFPRQDARGWAFKTAT